MPLNVLVVDDSDIIRRMILKTIDLSGVPVARAFQANDGREALELMQDEWVDVVIADLNMPVMDGMEMLRAMRDRDDLRNMPVIVVSTEGAATRIASLKELGIATFVRKPFTPEQIRDALRSLDGLACTEDHGMLIGELSAAVLERFAMLCTERVESLATPEEEMLVSVLRFSGVVTGSVTAAAPLSLCAEIARTALGIEDDVDEHEAADALGEVTNMLAGMVGTTADSDLHTSLTPPEIQRMNAEEWDLLASQPHVATLSVEGMPLLVSMRMRRTQ